MWHKLWDWITAQKANQKKKMSNFQLAQIIRDKIVKTNLKKDQKEKMCVCV